MHAERRPGLRSADEVDVHLGFARAHAERNGQASEFDAALDAFAEEWNLGTPERARFEKEYLVAVGTRAEL